MLQQLRRLLWGRILARPEAFRAADERLKQSKPQMKSRMGTQMKKPERGAYLCPGVDEPTA